MSQLQGLAVISVCPDFELNVDQHDFRHPAHKASQWSTVVLSHNVNIMLCGSANGEHRGLRRPALTVAISSSIIFATTTKHLIARRFLVTSTGLGDFTLPSRPIAAPLAFSTISRFVMVSDFVPISLLVMLMLNHQASRGSVFAIGKRADKKVCSG
jgi:hypothetical protein